MQTIQPNNGRLWSEQHSGNAISYHGPGLVNISGVSVTNVKHFMGCVAIINTPISSVLRQGNCNGKGRNEVRREHKATGPDKFESGFKYIWLRMFLLVLVCLVRTTSMVHKFPQYTRRGLWWTAQITTAVRHINTTITVSGHIPTFRKVLNST